MEVKSWQLWVVKLNQFLSKPLGMLIGFIIVIILVALFFIIKGSSDQQRAIDIARDTHSVVENTERIAADTKTIITNLQIAVADLKEDNAQQTIILCKLILGGRVELSGDDVAEIERICQERIQQLNATNITGAISGQPGTSPSTSTSSPPATVTPEPRPPATPGLPDIPDDPVPPEEPGLIGGAIDAVEDFIGRIL